MEKSINIKVRDKLDIPGNLLNLFIIRLPFVILQRHRSALEEAQNKDKKSNISNVDGIIQKVDQLLATEREQISVRQEPKQKKML